MSRFKRAIVDLIYDLEYLGFMQIFDNKFINLF